MFVIFDAHLNIFDKSMLPSIVHLMFAFINQLIAGLSVVAWCMFPVLRLVFPCCCILKSAFLLVLPLSVSLVNAIMIGHQIFWPAHNARCSVVAW